MRQQKGEIQMLEEKLKTIFTNVNDWLKFAENKNAALVAFNGGMVLGFLAIFLSNQSMHILLRIYLIHGTVCLTLGTIMGLISFIPKTKIPWYFSKHRIDESDNLLFYGHIANYACEDYLTKLKEGLEIKNDATKLERDYAEQIIINSKIALNKYNCFKVGIWLTIAAFSAEIAPLVGFIIYLKNKGKSR